MTRIREHFLTAATAAADLLAAPRVAAAWHEPSALAGFGVQGLAGHLAAQVFFARQAFDGPEATEPVISVRDYYARASWIGSDLDDDFNRGIRAGGDKQAADGAAELATRVAATVGELRQALPAAPQRTVRWPPGGTYALSLDDFLTTRLLEIVVHSDDLACSVGAPTPELPAEAVETVVDLLTRIAIRRHGAVNVLRGLSRSERAPASISAL